MNYELLTIIIAFLTFIATIAACIIASQIAKESAKYTVLHYINTKMVEMINAMYEINAIVGSDRKKTEELRAKVYEDTITMNNAAMALSLESKCQNFLNKKQIAEIEKVIQLEYAFLSLKTDAERISCIDKIYIATCHFNGYSKKEITGIDEYLKKTGGYNE